MHSGGYAAKLNKVPRGVEHKCDLFMGCDISLNEIHYFEVFKFLNLAREIF